MQRNMVALLCGMIGLAAWTTLAPADSLIFEYQSSLGTMPYDQSWSIEGQSIRAGGGDTSKCPLRPVDGQDFECLWYGGPDGNPANGMHDNDGTILASPNPVGDSGGGYVDGTRAPTSDVDFGLLSYPNGLFEGYYVNYVWKGDTPWHDTESYSEWMEFDDDGDNLEHVATHNGPTTPKGAGEFPGAPDHQVLRLVGGDGNATALSLPYVQSFNNQNGAVMLRKSYADTGITGPVTVVFRGALAVQQEGQRNHAFLLVRAYDPAAGKTVYFAFTWFMPPALGGVPICDAIPPSGDCGKFGVVNLQNGSDNATACAGGEGSDFDSPLLDGHDGGPNLGTVLPETFFTFRAICDPANDGVATIWVNEDTPNPVTGVVTNTTFADFRWGCKTGSAGDDYMRGVKVGLRQEDDTTAWIDYVQLYEGAVEPPEVGPCTFASDPVFDITGPTADVADRKVDELDLDVFSTECYTGPAPAVGVFDALSQKCKCMDLNGDEAIDHEDFGRFQACYTGADGTLDTSCDD